MSSTLNDQVKELSAHAEAICLPFWDDFKSAYVLGKFSADMEACKAWLDGIKESDIQE